VKLKREAIYVLTLLLISGCAAGPTTQEFEALNKRLTRVEKARDDNDARVEELESKLRLLREKLGEREDSGRALDVRDMAPPEGLKVIKLGDATVSIKGSGVKGKGADVKGKAPLKKGPTVAAEVAGGGQVKKASSSESPKAIYKRAQALFLSGRYGEARSVFAELSTSYPESSLADNAFFWSGEAYFAQKKFSEAIAQFNVVLERYPQGNKVPDSTLKKGLSYSALGEPEKAAAILQKLVDEYPRSEAARIASKRLKSL